MLSGRGRTALEGGDGWVSVKSLKKMRWLEESENTTGFHKGDAFYTNSWAKATINFDRQQ